MDIEILFDKRTQYKNLKIGWGISFLVNKKILFDTGENGKWLIRNIEELQIDINKIEAIVISHNHYDHSGGLWEILRIKKGINVYSCPNFGSEFNEKE